VDTPPFPLNTTFKYNSPKYNETYEEEIPDQKAREYHCLFDYRQRLAVLRDTPTTSFFKRFVKDTEHWFKWWIVTPSDKWWEFSANEKEVRKAIERVLELLETKGYAWLNDHSKPQDMKVHFQKLQQRKASA